MHPYDYGHHRALHDLGVKTAGMTMVSISRKLSPASEFHKKLQTAFRIKTPKFDVSAMMKRLLNNPFGPVTKLLSGELKPLKV